MGDSLHRERCIWVGADGNHCQNTVPLDSRIIGVLCFQLFQNCPFACPPAQKFSLAAKQLFCVECRRHRCRPKVWASRFLNLLDVRRDQAKYVTTYSKLMIRLYWYINGQPACPTISPQPCAPMRPSQKPEGTAWQRSKTSDKLLGAFRLARAVKIEDPDLLQTTSGFNCAALYMPPVQTMEFTNNASWPLVHAVWSLNFPH